jgi:hypothetical protein
MPTVRSRRYGTDYRGFTNSPNGRRRRTASRRLALLGLPASARASVHTARLRPEGDPPNGSRRPAFLSAARPKGRRVRPAGAKSRTRTGAGAVVSVRFLPLVRCDVAGCLTLCEPELSGRCGYHRAKLGPRDATPAKPSRNAGSTRQPTSTSAAERSRKRWARSAERDRARSRSTAVKSVAPELKLARRIETVGERLPKPKFATREAQESA